MGNRLFYVAAGLTLVIIAMFALDIWMVVAGVWPPLVTVIVFALQCLMLVSIVWGAYSLLDLRVFRPLHLIKDQVKIVTHIDSEYRFELPEKHYLGDLPKCAEELGQSLARERGETARAMESAADRVDQRKARLEAILHDLTEGVVVCTLNHLIVLFNQAAASLLQDAGPLGLHRSVTALFEGDDIEHHLKTMLARYYHTDEVDIGEFGCRLAGSAAGRVAVRMNLIIDPDGSCSGYVLSLAGKGLLRIERHKDSGVSVLTDRPEFYDFSLFDRDAPGELMDSNLLELDYVVFDTETTGLNPSKGDEIVQISGVRVINNRVLESDHFDILVNPRVPIPKQSIRFHGITDDMVTDAPGICEALNMFHEFTRDAVLVAHNAAFDMKFIKLKESSCGVAFDHPVLDTLLLSFVLQPNHSVHTLDAIAARFGIEIKPELRHTALGDSQATAEIFVRMLTALEQQGMFSLREAIEASNQVFEIRRLQEQH